MEPIDLYCSEDLKFATYPISMWLTWFHLHHSLTLSPPLQVVNIYGTALKMWAVVLENEACYEHAAFAICLLCSFCQPFPLALILYFLLWLKTTSKVSLIDYGCYLVNVTRFLFCPFKIMSLNPLAWSFLTLELKRWCRWLLTKVAGNRRHEEMTTSSHKERGKSQTFGYQKHLSLYFFCLPPSRSQKQGDVKWHLFESTKESSSCFINSCPPLMGWTVMLASKFKVFTCFLPAIKWLTPFQNPLILAWPLLALTARVLMIGPFLLVTTFIRMKNLMQNSLVVEKVAYIISVGDSCTELSLT